METLFVIGQIIFGGYFVWNGINHFLKLDQLTGYAQFKNVPMPKSAVIGSGLLLVLGGLGVALSLYPHGALVLLLVFLVPTTLMMHDFWKAAPDQRQAEQIQFSKNVALIGALLMMFSLPW